MKKILVLGAALLGMASCKNKSSEAVKSGLETSIDEGIELPNTGLGIDCYVYESNGSKISLQIISIDDEVSGKLTYSLLEKDTNRGTFTGIFENNILWANYTFLSEGIESTREVAFLLKDGKLIEGYGEIEVDGAMTTFKDKDALSFSSTMPLNKTQCPETTANCLFLEGRVFSNLRQTCLELATLNIKLNPLKEGAIPKGPAAYLIFSEDGAEAELFLPGSDTGLLLEKTNLGNWSLNEYVLLSWKGYVLQKNGVPIYGG